MSLLSNQTNTNGFHFMCGILLTVKQNIEVQDALQRTRTGNMFLFLGKVTISFSIERGRLRPYYNFFEYAKFRVTFRLKNVKLK